MITKHVCSLCVIKHHLYANVAYYFLLQVFARNLSLLLHKFICVSSLICLQHWWGGKESVVCVCLCVLWLSSSPGWTNSDVWLPVRFWVKVTLRVSEMSVFGKYTHYISFRVQRSCWESIVTHGMRFNAFACWSVSQYHEHLPSAVLVNCLRPLVLALARTYVLYVRLSFLLYPFVFLSSDFFNNILRVGLCDVTRWELVYGVHFGTVVYGTSRHCSHGISDQTEYGHIRKKNKSATF